jgi:uncharacterized protein YcfJ
MLNRTLKLAAAALIGAATLAPNVASAQYYGAPPPAYYGGSHDGWGAPPVYDDRAYYDRAGYGRDYDRNARDDRNDRRRDRREYRGRRCDRGTGGTILGAIAGGLLGNAAVGRGDRAAGTIVGAGVGALAGRAIDRDC